jgi:hypothetical protein
MKTIVAAVSVLSFLTFTVPARAFLLDDFKFMTEMEQMMDRFTLASSDQMNTFTTTMQTVNTNYLNAMLQLSTDIGTMADRIVYTEELIGQMADRIVKTEAMMAQMTVLMAQIAAGQNADPEVVIALQDAIIGTCQESVTTP